jgi:hypothetical protein
VVRSPSKAPISTLSPPWKYCHGRNFSDDVAERRSLILTCRFIGILDFLDATAANDGAHLTRGSFCGSPGDVVAQLSGHRIKLVQRVIPSIAATDSLGLFRVPSSGRAQMTWVSSSARGPWREGRENAPETSGFAIHPATSLAVSTIANVAKRVALDNFPRLQK